MSVSPKELAGVDVIKYIMAYCVVAIHFRPNYNSEWQYPEIFEWFIRLAVPFFFIASGYFVQAKIMRCQTARKRSQYLNIRIKRLVKLWISWILISLPMAMASYGLLTGNGIDKIDSSAKNYMFMLVFGGWAPHAAPLWFIYSMIWVTIIVKLSIRKRYSLAWLLGVFLILTVVYWSTAHFDISAIKKFDIYTRNILGGGVYILSGMQLARAGKANLFRWTYSVPLLLFGMILFHFKLPFAELIGGLALFIIALKLPILQSKFFYTLRMQSMWIYFTHEYVLFFFFIVFHVGQTSLNPYLLMLIVFATVGILAIILNKLQVSPHFKFLNSLIS